MMKSPFLVGRALVICAGTMLFAVSANDAFAGRRDDHADSTMMPGGTHSEQMGSEVVMDMPMGEGHGGDHSAHGSPGDTMDMPMDHGADGAQPAAVHGGHETGAHGGHAMPDMRAMGSLAANVHEMHLAATQRVLAHKMTIYALLVGLGIDREQNLDLLRQAQSQFARVQDGLRDGDDSRGLDGIANSAMRVKLEEVDGYWSRYNEAIQQIVQQPSLTVDHVTRLTAMDAELQRSLRSMAEAVERYSYDGRGYSILLPTVRHAQHLSAMVQELAAEFLLVAYGHDVAASEQALRETAAEFDMVLGALTNGDHELHVLGAPTPEIMAQYNRIRRQWQQCWSAIETMSAEDRTDPSMIGAVLSQVERVAVEVDVAVGLYHYL